MTVSKLKLKRMILWCICFGFCVTLLMHGKNSEALIFIAAMLIITALGEPRRK